MAYRPRVENESDARTPSEALVRDVIAGWFPTLTGLQKGFIGRIQERAVQRRIGQDRRKLKELIEDMMNGTCYPKEGGFPKESRMFREAFESGKAQFPDRVIKGEAAEGPIIALMKSSGFDFTNAKDFADVIAYILQQKPGAFEKSETYYVIEGKARRAAAAVQEDMRIAGLKRETINRITSGETKNGRPVYPVANSNNWGGVDYVDAAPLEQMSLEELTALEKQTNELRALIKMSPDEFRAYRKKLVDEARRASGQPREFRPGDNDSLSMSNLPEGATQATTDHTAPKPYIINCNGVDPFIDKSTGLEYSRTSLFDMARNNLPLFRKLTGFDHERLNKILATKE